MTTADEPFDILSIVLQRSELVARLDEASADKRTLTAELDYSRSTIDRAMRDLEAHDLVAYESGAYDLTRFGERVVTGTTDLVEEIAVARDLEPVLEHLPTDEFDLDLCLLADADVYLPEPGNPWAMVNRHVGVLEESDHIRAVLPLTGLHAHQIVHDRVVNHGADAEMVGCPEVIRTFLTDPDFVPGTEEMDATDRHRMFQVPDKPPYFVGILDDVVQLGVDEQGEPRAIIESTHPEVRAWAERTYDEFRARATPVEVSSASSSVDRSTID